MTYARHHTGWEILHGGSFLYATMMMASRVALERTSRTLARRTLATASGSEELVKTALNDLHKGKQSLRM